MPKQGLFVGLVTLDLVYLVTALPQSNQKIVALEDSMTAGGPAANAAVTFSHLGNSATLLSSVGQHPSRQLVLADLQSCGDRRFNAQPHSIAAHFLNFGHPINGRTGDRFPQCCSIPGTHHGYSRRYFARDRNRLN